MSGSASLWPLRLLSLAIAVVLWFLYSYSGREQTLSERALVDVPVTYNTPQGLVLLNPQSEVSIRVSGNEEAIRNLNPFQVAAVIDVEPRAGIQEIVLGEENVSRPPGIDVVSISPDRLSLQVDREMTKRLRVIPAPRGEPAAGAEEGEYHVEPEYVTVRGPKSLLERRDRILAPVSIEGKAISFTQPVTVDTQSPLIQVQGSSTVQVRVELKTPLLSTESPTAGETGAAP